MSEKRYQVFLSSTYTDLVKERDRVLRELAANNYIASGMEYFPAMDEEQFAFIKTIIDEADFYVAIVGGTLAPDGVGYSEKEFAYAVEKSIPVIVLLRSDWSSLQAEKRETDERKVQMLECYREKLSTNRLVRYWKDESELCLGLLSSLSAMSRRFPRRGWIRGGDKSPEELQRAIDDLEISKRQLTSLTEGSMLNIIKWRLRNNLDVQFSFASGGVYTESCLETSWRNLANYLLPRIKYERDLEILNATIREFIENTAKRAQITVAEEELDKIRKTFLENGLINIVINGLGQRSFATSGFGWAFVGDEAEKHEMTVNKNLGFWADIEQTITRHLNKKLGRF
jgi:hypothetical protein